MKTLRAQIGNRLREFAGPLTQDLVQSPGQFGLGKIPTRLQPEATTSAVCGFCSTGCGLNLHLKNGEAINLTPDTHYPVNLGLACPKGWEALTPLDALDRATMPFLRNAQGAVEAVEWNQALQTFTERFKAIQEKHGPAAVAFLSTGQIVTEEMALLGALAKFGMGLLHGDGNTRQCMATAVTAYKQSFGFDAPPFTYADFEESDVIVLVGSNLCIAHPIMWQRILRNRRQAEIIVIDPRATETALAATQHYAIKPKSDLAFFYGLAQQLIAGNGVDHDYVKAHTEGFAEFAQQVRSFTPEIVAPLTGITPARLQQLARTIAQGGRVSFWWTMGVNQSHEGTRVAQAIINLALLTGNIGRPGTGANSITGQCNAMGSRLFSNTTSLLGGHDFTNPEHRAKVAQALHLDIDRIPQENSWAYDQILQGIADEKIKGLWIIATNPAHSWIHQNGFQAVRKKLDFLVVQDMYTTSETALQADLILPAAGWGEKDGTLINSERRIGLVKKVRRAPGQALSDFNIFKLIAESWGCGDLFREWESPAAVFQIMKRLSGGQPCDISGIRDYQALDEAGGIQWPFPEGALAVATERRLFEDGKFYHPDGRARFIFETPRPWAEPTDAAYPFLLLTGRGTSAQWHTQTRTAKSSVLRKLYPQELYMEINPVDARRLAVVSKQKVKISSRRGAIEACAFLTSTIQPGQIFLPMHDATVNQLTYPEVDPYSRQPAYKACAVAVQPLKS